MKIYKIAQKTSSNSKMQKEAVSDRELLDKINSLKNDIKDVKLDNKDLEKRVASIERTIKDLNIGNRRFYQVETVFTSLQRKVERFEKVEREWNTYKKEVMDRFDKRTVEEKKRAQV